MIGVLIMGLVGQYPLQELPVFLLLNAGGVLISSIISAVIGVIAENQTAASGLSVPAMLVTSFLPMLSMFNASIRKFGQFLYSQQIYEQISVSKTPLSIDSVIIVVVNLAVVLIVYVYMYRKKHLLA